MSFFTINRSKSSNIDMSYSYCLCDNDYYNNNIKNEYIKNISELDNQLKQIKKNITKTTYKNIPKTQFNYDISFNRDNISYDNHILNTNSSSIDNPLTNYAFTSINNKYSCNLCQNCIKLKQQLNEKSDLLQSIIKDSKDIENKFCNLQNKFNYENKQLLDQLNYYKNENTKKDNKIIALQNQLNDLSQDIQKLVIDNVNMYNYIKHKDNIDIDKQKSENTEYIQNEKLYGYIQNNKDNIINHINDNNDNNDNNEYNEDITNKLLDDSITNEHTDLSKTIQDSYKLNNNKNTRNQFNKLEGNTV